MRQIIAAVTLCLLSLPVACQAQQPVLVATRGLHHHHHHAAKACPCGHVAPPVVVAPTVTACGGGCGVPVSGCGSCGVPVSDCGGCGVPVSGCGGGCGGCGSGLCNNWPEFYNRLYAEFYANNQWYVEAKKKENAARLARLRGLPEPEEVKAVR